MFVLHYSRKAEALLPSHQDVCIYCPTPIELYVGEGDHVIPAALGHFENELVFWRICRDCNSRISKSEQHLLRCAPEALFRRFVQPNIARSNRGTGWVGTDGIPPPKFTINRGDHFELVDASTEDPSTVFAVDQLVFQNDEQGEMHFRLFPTMTLTSFRAKISALKLRANSKIFLHADETNFQQYAALVKDVWPDSFLTEKDTEEMGTHNVPGRTHFKIHPDYWRAVAKIAFHYYLATTCRRVRGDEDGFAPIRQFIKEGGSCDAFFVEKGPRFAMPFGELSNGDAILPDVWAHILAVDESNQDVVATISLFMGPNRLAPTYSLNLGRLKIPLLLPGARTAHAYRYDADRSQSKYAGQVVELTTTRLR